MREIQKRRAAILAFVVFLCLLSFGTGYVMGQESQVVCPEVEFIYECPDPIVIDCDDPCPACPQVRVPVYIHPLYPPPTSGSELGDDLPLVPSTYLLDLGVGFHNRGLWSTLAWNPKQSRFSPVLLLTYDTDPPGPYGPTYVESTGGLSYRYGDDVNVDVDVNVLQGGYELDGWDRWRVGLGATIGLGPKR